MYDRVPIYSFANMHSHGREKWQVHQIINNNIIGGADVMLLMGNTDEGLHNVLQTKDYIEHAEGFRRANPQPMTLIPAWLLTERTTDRTIEELADAGYNHAKMLPEGRTTNSSKGVRRYYSMLPKIQRCAERGIFVHVHQQNPNLAIDNDDAEFSFLPVTDMFMQETDATIIGEHISDERGIPSYIEWGKSGRFFVTITAHHVAVSRYLVYGDVRGVCQPPILGETHRRALIDLIAEDHNWVIGGLDDATHSNQKKHVPKGRCACGASTSLFGLRLYAHSLAHKLFKNQEGIQTFINFTSLNARRKYELPPPSRSLTLVRRPYKISPISEFDGPWGLTTIVENFLADQTIDWDLE